MSCPLKLDVYAAQSHWYVIVTMDYPPKCDRYLQMAFGISAYIYSKVVLAKFTFWIHCLGYTIRWKKSPIWSLVNNEISMLGLNNYMSMLQPDKSEWMLL